MTQHFEWTRRGRLLYSLAISSGATLLILALVWADVLVQSRLRLETFYYAEQPTSGKVVIVAIDDASLHAYGRTVAEWPRRRHAELLQKLSDDGARVVALDILFIEPTNDDQRLADAITAARQSEARTRTILPIVAVSPSNRLADAAYASVYIPVDPLHQSAAAVGTANVYPEVDGTIRRIPVSLELDGQAWWSFSVVTFLSYLGVPASAYDQVIEWRDNQIALTPQHPTPLDEQEQMMLNYFGPPNQGSFAVYSYQAVLNGEVEPGAFDDKIVLVGLMNSSGATDQYPVPISLNGQLMAGVEIHANTIESLLQNRAIRRLDQTEELAMMGGLALVVSLIYGQTLGRRWCLILLPILTLAAMFIWLLVVLTYFNTYQIIIDPLCSMLALSLPAFGTFFALGANEIYYRRRSELLLDSVVAAANQRLNHKPIMEHFATDLSRLLKGAPCEIWLYDHHREVLRRAHPAVEDATLTLAQMTQAPDARAAERALLTGQQVVENNVIAIPLIWQTEKLGVMVGYLRGHIRRIHRPKAKLLDLFGLQAAAIIANVNLFHEVQQLSDVKTRMIRMASHDLKNPLSALMLYAQLLRDGTRASPAPPLTDQQKSYLGTMMASAERMQRLIDEILNIERARRGAMMMQPVHLGSLILECTTLVAPRIELKRHTLTTEFPDHLPQISGDHAQLREAFVNLLDNASKYTPDNGNIWFKAERVEGEPRIRITVRDTGYGIPEAAQANLFQEFYKVRTAETAHIEGTGLGLSLVKAIVEAHGGRIWCKSKEHEGTTFFVELPMTLGGGL